MLYQLKIPCLKQSCKSYSYIGTVLWFIDFFFTGLKPIASLFLNRGILHLALSVQDGCDWVMRLSFNLLSFSLHQKHILIHIVREIFFIIWKEFSTMYIYCVILSLRNMCVFLLHFTISSLLCIPFGFKAKISYYSPIKQSNNQKSNKIKKIGVILYFVILLTLVINC